MSVAFNNLASHSLKNSSTRDKCLRTKMKGAQPRSTAKPSFLVSRDRPLLRTSFLAVSLGEAVTSAIDITEKRKSICPADCQTPLGSRSFRQR